MPKRKLHMKKKEEMKIHQVLYLCVIDWEIHDHL